MKTKRPYLLSNEDIYNWAPSDAVYDRGNDYFFDGHVEELEYDPDLNEWTATVFGSDFYDVTIEIEDSHRIITHCECPAHYKYGKCKHCVAVLLEIGQELVNGTFAFESKDVMDSPKSREYHITDRIIQTFKEQHLQEFDQRAKSMARHPLKVEFHLIAFSKRYGGTSNYLTVELKVGVHRPYVVKGIGDFLDNVMNKESQMFTKKFTYDPSEHYFLDGDMELLELLYQALKSEDFHRSQNQFYPYGQSSKNERRLVVPPYIIDEFLAVAKSRNTTMDGFDYRYQAIEVKEEEQLPITFDFEKQSDEMFQLRSNPLKDMILFESYHLLFIDGAFYKLSPTRAKIVTNMMAIQNMGMDGSIPIYQDQVESFLSHVLPHLQKVSTVQIAPELSDQFIQHPLKGKLYLDLDGEQLTAKLEYHYGDTCIHPFLDDGSNQSDVILIRDVEKERSIMNLLEDTALKLNGQDCYIEGEEDLYDFLYHTVPTLEDMVDIYMTGSVKSMMLSEEHAPTASIDVEPGGDLLEISFDMKGIDPNEVEAVLQSLVEKKRYYRLPNGAFVSLEDEALQTIDNLIGELNPSQSGLADGKLHVPLYRGFQIDEIVSKGTRDTAKMSRTFQKLIRDIKKPDTIEFEIPETLNATLRDYQQVGFQWMKSLAHYRMGGILADDMGLGKTLQSITYLLSEQAKQETGSQKPSLIVAPASLVYNWKTEFEKFAPEMKVEVVYGAAGERMEVLGREADVYITSYPSLRQDIDSYKKMKFDSMILDEAQAIKNHLTKSSKAVKEILAVKKFALSGTPVENSLDEIWSIFEAILPGFFPNQKTFRNLPQEKIARMIRPFLLRRVKKDVLKELPDKIESVHYSELTKEQKQLYVGYLERIQSEAKASIQQEGFNNSRMQILAALTRLRQLCCHPSLFLENFAGESGKLEQLKELIGNARENGKRLLIFSQFTSMLSIIRTELDRLNMSYFYLDGQTPSQERIKLADRFNDGENDIFLISLKAGGTGLNLTGADTVVLYDLWWNPAIEEQAAGRAHRIGQKQVVQVMRMITQGTIEEKIYKLQQKKKELIEKVVQPGETMLNRLSEEDIREILDI